MASCWKVSWNVDPLPLSVPERWAALVDEDALLPDDEPLLDGEAGELDEEHAARDRAVATTAAPAVVTCCRRRSCISDTPFTFRFYVFPGRDERSPGQPVSLQTVVCQYSVAALPLPAGKRVEYKWGQGINIRVPRFRERSSGGGGAQGLGAKGPNGW